MQCKSKVQYFNILSFSYDLLPGHASRFQIQCFSNFTVHNNPVGILLKMLILIHQVWCRARGSVLLITSQVMLMLPDCRSHVESQGSRQWYSNFSTHQNYLVKTQMAIHTQVSDSQDHRDRDWTDAAASQRILAATKTPKHTKRKKEKMYSPLDPTLEPSPTNTLSLEWCWRMRTFNKFTGDNDTADPGTTLCKLLFQAIVLGRHYPREIPFRTQIFLFSQTL